MRRPTMAGLAPVIALAFMPFVADTALATGPDRQTLALLEELGIRERGEPLRETSWWRKPEKIYLTTGHRDPEGLDEMLVSAREVAGDVEIVAVTGPLDADTIRSMEVLIGTCTPEIVRQAENLLWLQDFRHGVDRCMIPEIREASFVLTNTAGTSGPPMAEHVIAMMMTMTRGLNHMQRAQRDGRWLRGSIDFPIIEVGGKTMLVAGLGGIGTEVARRAAGLGMTVVATRNSSREGPDFVEYIGLSDELYELAGRADVVVNALPLTDDTRGLFARRFFDAVKPGAWYLSIGRGETTVTEDLMSALRDGRLAGAGLDVTDPEPLPPDHELWSYPNVVISPHVSATTDRDTDRRWLLVRENLRRYINGERLLNVVNTDLGY